MNITERIIVMEVIFVLMSFAAISFMVAVSL
jgi:hypothetical protein